MAERTVLEGMTGATLAITATLPATYDAAGYGATTIVWSTVGLVENFGPHGMTAQITEFTPLDTGVITKIKGSKNYGNMDITLASLPSDSGQDIVEAASESSARYSVKITYPDTSIHYLDVLVYKFENAGGAANDVHKINAGFAVCRKPTIVPQA